MVEHGKLHLADFVDPHYQENGYVLRCSGENSCWIIDPGFPPACEELVAYLRQAELTPQAILLTHAHVDHIAGIKPVLDDWGPIPIWCPKDESELLANPVANLSAFLGTPVTAPPAERLIHPGDTLALGDTKWEVLDVAGHSPGGLAYYCASERVLISGDAVFANSIGRYDFPHSSRSRLIANIHRNILTLPDNVSVYSGHGPAATIGEIKRHNVVLRDELVHARLG